MSNATPTDMDSFLPLITTTDTKMRLFICSKLLAYLSDAENSIVCSDIGFLIDTLVNWLQSSNFKVVQIDLDILSELISRMKTDFHPYYTTLIPPLVDKLGDSKDTIREKTLSLFQKLIECDVVTVQNLFDRIGNLCFSHKNSNVREQIMHFLIICLDDYGASSLSISKLIPSIVKLLSDPNASVRSTAFDTLCNIYKHVGERLRIDLQRKYSIPHNKLPALMTKFDEIKASSDDGVSSIFQSLKVEDETDQSEKSSIKSNFSSVSASRPPITPSSLGLSSASKSKISSLRKPNGMNNQAGAIDEDTFLNSFEDVPNVQIYSNKDVEDNLKKYHAIIENANEDWSKRVDSLKKIRSLIVAGALSYEEFHIQINLLLPSFHSALKDLRSQVVREACITVAFLSKNLTSKFDHFAESVLSSIINLIQNSAKVIASSGLICIRFILQHTHAPRLTPIIVHSLNNSKSKEIRKACCEFINLILQTWNPHSVEKHASIIQEAIKKGIADADAEARAQSRNAYKVFSQHFPELGESLKNSLDYPYRKLLSSNSNSGSNSSLSRIPAIPNMSVRSNSAIDLQAVKRAKTRAHYAAMARQKFGSGVPLPKSKNVSTPPVPEQRTGRTKNRISVSQPTSRSGSPSSRLSYTNYLSNSGSIARAKRNIKPLSAQRILQQSREAETELADALGNCDTTPYSFRSLSKNYRGLEDHSDESETSSICSEQSFDSYRRPSDSMSWNGSQHRLYRDRDMCKDISEIIANCENAHWNERREGLQSLQYYIQDGNKLGISDLKKIMEIFTKIFNDPHIKVFSLFLDSLNELIRSHNEDLCFCLHLLLTRLFNKLGTDLLNSVHSKIMKTLDIVFDSFPPDLQLQSVFRFLVDPTQTPNTRVKLATLNYLIKLTSVVDPSSAFNSNANDSGKDYPTLALVKLVNWTMTDNLKIGPELRRASKDAVLALFNLNPAQATRRFSAMSKECQEAAAAVCKNRSSLNSTVDHEPIKNSSTCDFPDIVTTEFQVKDNDALKTYMEELSQCTSEISKKKLLTKITTLVNEVPSDIIIQHFKLLLGNIISLLGDSEPSSIKEMALCLLQAVVKRRTVTFLLKNFSDLIITRVIAVCSDPAKDVVKAAENCAIILSTHLPAESVVRVIVPLITSEAAPVKLVAIKMLTRLVECSDDSVVMSNIDQIMNVLLVAYDDTESSVRKAAVFCMVALHKQSEEMKTCLEPYINRLQGAKLKLLQLYIRRAEQGSSMPTSPKNA